MLINPETAEAMVLELDSINYEKDFVAIGISGDTHCGLIVNYNQKPVFFHFYFDEIRMEKIESLKSDYVFNLLPIIDENEVINFLAKCELIVENEPDLEFGFTYNGEFFNEKGEIIFKIPKNNITNCVFFCISLISGFIVSERYFEYTDWKPDDLAKNWVNRVFLKKKEIGRFVAEDIGEFWDTVCRIPPIDYFSSASITDLPIKKVIVDNYSPFFSKVIKDKISKRVS